MEKQDYERVKNEVRQTMMTGLFNVKKTTRQLREDIFNYAYDRAYTIGREEQRGETSSDACPRNGDRLPIAARALEGILSNSGMVNRTIDLNNEKERAYLAQTALSLADSLMTAAAATDKAKTKTK